MSDSKSKNLIIGSGPAAATGAAMRWIISLCRILVGASNWDRQIVRQVLVYGIVKIHKECEVTRSKATPYRLVQTFSNISI